MIRADYVGGVLAAGLLLVYSTGCPAPGAARGQAEQETNGELAAVKTLVPQRTSLRRTTTQPAIVHAYYQAEVYAKVTGYLKELNVDIGQTVQAGSVLGTIDAPEMLKSREKQEATIRRLQAEGKRAEAEITVAEANEKSAAAMLEQARADVGSRDARLKADRIEHERVSELVQNKAVAERLGDEAQERLESAQALKSAAEAAVVSAEANVRVAGAELESARADLATARERTEVAAKELEELDALIAYATLRAPFQGVVTERHADPGDLIRNAPPSSGRDSPPLVVIAALDKVRVRVPVPERDAPWAGVGDQATMTFSALPGESFSGKVSRIAGSLDESTRTMTVEIDLENPQNRLLPGMFGESTIVLEEQADSLVLPAAAVRHDESGGSYVYVVGTDDAILVVDVTTGLDDGKQVEIVSGLTGDERVVGPTIDRLKPEQKVRVE